MPKTCKNKCGENTTKLYTPFCSSKCRREYSQKSKPLKLVPCVICGELFSETLDKRQTCSNPSKNCTQDLKAQNNLQKYGVRNVKQIYTSKEKAVQTCLQRYGVDNPFQSEIFKEKARQTNIRNIGVPYPSMQRVSKEAINLFQNEKLLKEEYLTNKLSVADICLKYNTYPNYVTSYLRKYNIPQRYDYCTTNSVREIESFIDSLQLSYSTDRKILEGKEIDIYISSRKMGIEFNGVFHHSEEHQPDKFYHLHKTELAESKGVHLVHIYSDDWLYRKSIVKSRLKQILRVGDISYYARSCELGELSSREASIFLKQHHLQGGTPSSIKLGLFYNSSLVACMTFGRPRAERLRERREGEYELLRYCSSGAVIGGASRLLKFFITKYSPSKIISYADRHWTTLVKPNLYDRLNFKLVSKGQPDYMYIIGSQRKHRFNFRKSILQKKLPNYNPNLTELRNLANHGVYRIWGCGSLRYEWTPS